MRGSADFKAEVLRLDIVEVPHTGTGQTLAQLGVTLDPRVKELYLENVGANNILMNEAAPVGANSFTLVSTMSVEVPGTISALSRVAFLAENAPNAMNVLQRGD